MVGATIAFQVQLVLSSRLFLSTKQTAAAAAITAMPPTGAGGKRKRHVKVEEEQELGGESASTIRVIKKQLDGTKSQYFPPDNWEVSHSQNRHIFKTIQIHYCEKKLQMSFISHMADVSRARGNDS